MIVEHRRFLKLPADAEIGDGRLVQLGEIDIAFEDEIAAIGITVEDRADGSDWQRTG